MTPAPPVSALEGSSRPGFVGPECGERRAKLVGTGGQCCGGSVTAGLPSNAEAGIQTARSGAVRPHAKIAYWPGTRLSTAMPRAMRGLTPNRILTRMKDYARAAMLLVTAAGQLRRHVARPC